MGELESQVSAVDAFVRTAHSKIFDVAAFGSGSLGIADHDIGKKPKSETGLLTFVLLTLTLTHFFAKSFGWGI